MVQEQTPLDGILKKFAHPISLLPNLHTVQIHFKFKGYYDTASDSLVRNYLKGYTYERSTLSTNTLLSLKLNLLQVFLLNQNHY